MAIEPDLFTTTRSGDAEVTARINAIFLEAIKLGASDVHFEDCSADTRVRFRIQGRMQVAATLSRFEAQDLDTKIRAKAGMSSSERQAPLDGRFFLRFDVDGNSIRVDVRVNVLPIYTGADDGQKIVCRLLDQSRGTAELRELPFPKAVHDALDSVLASDQGMILLTGPTGSGKTSTLYAMLQRFRNPHVNVMTAENPIEYTVPEFNQVSIEPPGRTFATALRAFLRQDPDVILVGEIRDEETAQIASEAALTGHLLLSTLHTNTAAQTFLRLAQKGVPNYTVAQTTLAVLAQRLLDGLCSHCSISVTPTADQQQFLDRIDYRVRPMRSATGCTECAFTGKCGRFPIAELILVDHAVRDGIESNDVAAIEAAAKKQTQYRSLAHAALDACADGHTTLASAMSLAHMEALRAAAPLLEMQEVF